MIPTITPRFIGIVMIALVPLVYWGFNFVVLYHLLRFGVGVQPKRFAAIYFLGSSFLFVICVLLFMSIDILSFKDELANFFKGNTFFNIY